LVAYVVSAPEATPSVDELRSYLQTRLPDYMLPGIIVYLDALPLTPNGKIDRRMLPAPDRSRPEFIEAFVEARDPVEQVLTQLWNEVLNVGRIGVHDNFFALGGHSLMAVQLVSHVSKAFQLKIPLRSLFEMPTIAQMAQILVQYEKIPGSVAKIAQLRQKIAALSPEGVRALLEANRKKESDRTAL
jgi:acyl carrier protein